MSPDIAHGIVPDAKDRAPRADWSPLRLVVAEPVLVIDDNYHVAIELARLLEELNVAARCVGRPADARHAALEMKPKLALVDINLAGGFEGLDLAQELRALYGTRIVLVTAYTVRDLMHRLPGGEQLSVIFKPVERDVLAATLAMILNADPTH